MPSAKLLPPLSIPELGPSLGKLVTGTGRMPGGMALEVTRHRLATRIIGHAGEARRLAANDARGPAVAALARELWLAAWEEAVGTVADALAQRIDERLAAEANAVHMPRRLRRRVLLQTAERRALAARLGSSGAILIRALDDVQRHGEPAVSATALERDAVTAWQEALKTAARRLEAAWLALEDGVEAEGARWADVADRVASWRKPLWPVAVVGGIALLVVLWLGLTFGGYLPAPAWLVQFWARGLPSP